MMMAFTVQVPEQNEMMTISVHYTEQSALREAMEIEVMMYRDFGMDIKTKVCLLDRALNNRNDILE
jgi:hypothetical protein